MNRVLVLLCGVLLVGCGDGSTESPSVPEMPRFAAEQLAMGRGVWMGTCRNCHLMGVSGAPAVTDQAGWAPRIRKGRDALYRSALAGIKGADGKYRMPPRGGNQSLSDGQVEQAVDYMLEAVAALGKDSGR